MVFVFTLHQTLQGFLYQQFIFSIQRTEDWRERAASSQSSNTSQELWGELLSSLNSERELLNHLVASSKSKIRGFCGEKTEKRAPCFTKERHKSQEPLISLGLDGFSEQRCCVHLEQSSGDGYPLLLTPWKHKQEIVTCGGKREVKPCSGRVINQVWAQCPTWQEHPFLPHHSVKALWEGLNEVVSIGHPGCSVDVLGAHGSWVRGTVRYVLSDRARKQHWLLGEAEETRESRYSRDLKVSDRMNSDSSPGSQFLCDSGAKRDSNPWCHGRLWWCNLWKGQNHHR